MAAGGQSRPVVVIVGSVNVDLVVAAERLPGRGLVAAVGDDGLAQAALAELHQEGVDVEGVSAVPGEATGAALIVVDAGGDNQIAVGAGANAALAPDDVRRRGGGIRDRAGCLLVSLEISYEAVRAAVDAG